MISERSEEDLSFESSSIHVDYIDGLVVYVFIYVDQLHILCEYSFIDTDDVTVSNIYICIVHVLLILTRSIPASSNVTIVLEG